MLTSEDSAIIAIHEVEASGADTSELNMRFNNAVNLVEQAEASHFYSCNSTNDCMNEANEIFKSITNEANILKDQADMNSHTKMITSVTVVVLSSLIVSFVAVYSYKRYKSFALRRFLNMEIQAER